MRGVYVGNSLIISENPLGNSSSGRWGGRLRCESVLALDMRKLQRGDLLDNVGGGFQWRWSLGEGRGFSVMVNVQADDLMLSFPAKNGELRQETVGLAKTPCHYGSARVWFVCPACCHRAAKLYFRRDRFLCRRCQGLRYASQLSGKEDRPRLSAQRIRRKLGGSADLTLPFPHKPERMHWRTYERLKAKCQRHEWRAIEQLSAWVDRFERLNTC